MAATIQTLEIILDPADLEALVRDLGEIFATYGATEADCQPHLRRIREAEILRARAAFGECILAANAG